MGKLLRFLVFVFLALSVVTLVLGSLLFAKRELLKGRTQKLETAVIELCATIEDESGTVDRMPDYPARDISPVTSEVIDTPELSTFWDNYSNELEVVDLPTVRIGQQERLQLMAYHQIDPVTQKVMKDGMGQKMTDGPGTMQDLLSSVIAKATEQRVRLNDTRAQLKASRIELVDTIVELNQSKSRLRASLKKVEDLENEVVRLNGEIRQLNTRIETLQEDLRAKEDEIAQAKQEVALLQEKQLEDQAEIERMKKENDDLRKRVGEFSQQPVVGQETAVRVVGEPDRLLEPGEKGRVVAVNDQWNFVVIELTDAFLREILGDDLSAPVPAYELMIKRPGEDEQFVTKVRLLTVKKTEKLAICEILVNWKQIPVEKGDVAFL